MEPTSNPIDQTEKGNIPTSEEGSLSGRAVLPGITTDSNISNLLNKMLNAIKLKKTTLVNLKVKMKTSKASQTIDEAAEKEKSISAAIENINTLLNDLNYLIEEENNPRKVDLKKLHSKTIEALKHFKTNSDLISKFLDRDVNIEEADIAILKEVDTLYEAMEYLLDRQIPASQKGFQNFRKANLNHRVWYMIRPFFFGTKKWKEAKDDIKDVANLADEIIKLSEATTATLKTSNNSIQAAKHMSDLILGIADVLGKITDVELGKGSAVSVSWERGQTVNTATILFNLNKLIKKHKEVSKEIEDNPELEEVKSFLNQEIEKLEEIQTKLSEFKAKSKYLPIISGCVMATVFASLIAAVVVGAVLFTPMVLLSIPALLVILGIVRGALYKAEIAAVPIILPDM